MRHRIWCGLRKTGATIRDHPEAEAQNSSHGWRPGGGSEQHIRESSRPKPPVVSCSDLICLARTAQLADSMSNIRPAVRGNLHVSLKNVRDKYADGQHRQVKGALTPAVTSLSVPNDQRTTTVDYPVKHGFPIITRTLPTSTCGGCTSWGASLRSLFGTQRNTGSC